MQNEKDYENHLKKVNNDLQSVRDELLQQKQ